MHKPLRQQTIVITGASSGIGLATAQRAARGGARVLLVARDGAALAEAKAAIVAQGGHAAIVAADVGSRTEIERVVTAAETAFGGFDTWVNGAGQTVYGHLWEVSDADHQRLLQTNLWGTIYGSLAAVEHLKRKGGALINVGSVASEIAVPMQGMYTASKHAVKGFTDSLRMELLQDGVPVSVTLVKPTSIATPLPQRARNYMAENPSLPPPSYRPEEVARAILHAAVHPQRDIYVGGSGRALTAFNQIAPSIYDLFAPMITAAEKRGVPTDDREGALHEPNGGGHVSGDETGAVRERSLYTRAHLHPLAPGVLMAAGVSAFSRFMSKARNDPQR